MFFAVDSSNRHAVRKVLTASGMPAAEVRNLRNGQLGKALFDAVAANKLTEDAAVAACGTKTTMPDTSADASDSSDMASSKSGEITTVIVDDVANGHSKPAKVTNGNGKPHDFISEGEMLAALVREIAGKTAVKAAVDAETVRKLVQEAIQAERVKPAIVEIKIGEIVTAVNGESFHTALPDVLLIVNTRIDGRRQHVWLYGPSGSGKSYLAKQVADVLKLPYYFTGAVQSKYDIIGFVPPHYAGNLEECPSLMTPFRRAFQFGGVFGLDDIDRSHPQAFASFNEALANGRFAFPDGMVEAHPDFVCIATANTWGTGATADYVGATKVDGATLTRFVRMEAGYDEELERSLVGADGKDWAKFVQSIRRAVESEGLKILITPRHTLQGAALLKGGMERGKVERYTVFAGVDSSTEGRIRSAARRS